MNNKALIAGFTAKRRICLTLEALHCSLARISFDNFIEIRYVRFLSFLALYMGSGVILHILYRLKFLFKSYIEFAFVEIIRIIIQLYSN